MFSISFVLSHPFSPPHSKSLEPHNSDHTAELSFGKLAYVKDTYISTMVRIEETRKVERSYAAPKS